MKKLLIFSLFACSIVQINAMFWPVSMVQKNPNPFVQKNFVTMVEYVDQKTLLTRLYQLLHKLVRQEKRCDDDGPCLNTENQILALLSRIKATDIQLKDLSGYPLLVRNAVKDYMQGASGHAMVKQFIKESE